MRWKGRRQSSNIEDRRGMGGGMGGMRFPGGLGGGMRGGGMRRGGGIGIFGILILLGIAWLLGINPLALLSGELGGGGGYVEQPQQSATGGGTFASPQEEEMKEFVAVVLAETEDTWNQILGQQYREPNLVLFSGGAQSGCGFAQSAVGPFYCPADEKVYIDLSFFDELSRRFGAPGDFAQAYVIAHEVGHHVQTVVGIEEKVRQARASMSESEGNALSVRVELQADCFAGVWAHDAHQKSGLLEPGDIEEALGAASAVGDDTLQKQTGGRVVPDSFTHGSSEQRMRWFETGYRSGDINDCDTFSADNL